MRGDPKYKSTPLQKRAYSLCKEARRRGKLVPLPYCEGCKEPVRLGKDGRKLIQGHHEDYNKPLEVVWLCAKCHRKVTRTAFGERNGWAVLKENLVIAARLLRKEGFAIRDIADFYGVSMQGLSHAINKTSWKWLCNGKAEREKRV